jgi:hypothetical protein
MSLQISISNSIRGYRSVPGGVPVDPDAQAFITAAAITDPTQQAAINTLVVDLKGYSIWSKMKGLYPFVGGTATTHKYNLKDPRDLDAAFRLGFSGSWTHNANGITGNGSDTYALSYFNPSAIFSNTKAHLSIYIRNNTTGSFLEWGLAISNLFFNLYAKFSGNFSARINSADSPLNSANTDSTGLYIASRTGANAIFLKKNNSAAVTGTNAESNRPNGNLFLGQLNLNGSPLSGYYTNRNYAFASIGYDLSEQNASDLYTIIDTLNQTRT